MALGSFVNGFVNGMNIRDTRDNNKRVRGMEDTRFEREGEKHGWNKESHEWTMQRARIAAAKADARGKKEKIPSRADDVRSIMRGYDGGGYSVAPATNGNKRSPDYFPGFGGGAEMSYGAGTPVAMVNPYQQSAPAEFGVAEAIPLQGAGPAVQQAQLAQAQSNNEFDYIPGQGFIPTNRGYA